MLRNKSYTIRFACTLLVPRLRIPNAIPGEQQTFAIFPPLPVLREMGDFKSLRLEQFFSWIAFTTLPTKKQFQYFLDLILPLAVDGMGRHSAHENTCPQPCVSK